MNFFLFKTGLFEIEQDSLVFKGESPSATLEICPKIVHCMITSQGYSGLK